MVAGLAVVVVALLWIGGELHRDNCIRSGNTGCSVVPWDSGSSPPAVEQGNLTPRGCQELRIDNALALNTADRKPVPPECR